MGTRRGRRPAAHRAPLRGPRPRAPPTRHQRALHPRHAAGRPLAQHRRARRRAGPHRSGRLVQRAVPAHRRGRVSARAARPRPQRLHVRDAAGRDLGAGVWRRCGGGAADAGRLARCAVGESGAGDALRGAGAGVLSRDVRGCDSAAEGGGTQTWGSRQGAIAGSFVCRGNENRNEGGELGSWVPRLVHHAAVCSAVWVWRAGVAGRLRLRHLLVLLRRVRDAADNPGRNIRTIPRSYRLILSG